MTDLGPTPPNLGSAMPAIFKIAGIDVYTWRARIAPAVLACLPAVTLGVLALPLLENAQKLWSLTSVAVTTFAALAARRAGNRVQPELIESWDGLPTTARLRFRSNTSTQEISRRHELVERTLGVNLPTAEEEHADPTSADLIYADAMRRLVAMVRGNPKFWLANVENRNYGYARNLLGLKSLGQICATASLVLSAAIASLMGFTEVDGSPALLLLPGLVSLAALLLWPQVDGDFVRPSAEAYADRIVEALDQLGTSAG